MSTQSIIGSFVKRAPVDQALADVWARLEQEQIPDGADKATLSDLHQMISAAMSGETAHTYLYDICPYVAITDGVVKITLPFYVWPSSMDMVYDLSASVGTVGPGIAYEEHRSFDLIFDHADVADCKFVFDGTLIPEMPYFTEDGSRVAIDQADITVAGSRVFLPMPLTTVLRAEGIARGWRHELVIEVIKAGHDYDPAGTDDTDRRDYTVDPPQSEITVAWTDENGEIQSDIIDMRIPGCVEDLLVMCLDDATPKGDPGSDHHWLFVLYSSTCDGSVLAGRWERQR